MDPREIVARFIAPDDRALARRIEALLWAYERGEFQDRMRHEPLVRRKPRERREEDGG